MMGKLIVFEGIDGSGKSTQFKETCAWLENEGIEFRRIVFPQYSEPSSALIKMYLSGEFGTDPNDVNAYAASAFYAVDRYASYAKAWRDYYLGGGLLVSDRYTTSNAIHQGSKLSPDERMAFFDWLYNFEFDCMGLPKPDAVIYMNIPLKTAEENMRERERKTQTSGDIHERDESYLAKCSECGTLAAQRLGWYSVDCAPDGTLRPIDDIQREVRSVIAEILAK